MILYIKLIVLNFIYHLLYSNVLGAMIKGDFI